MKMLEWQKHHRESFPRHTYVGNIENMKANASYLGKTYGANVFELEELAMVLLDVKSLYEVIFFRCDSKLVLNPTTQQINEFTREKQIHHASLVYDELLKNQGDVKNWGRSILKKTLESPHFWEEFVFN